MSSFASVRRELADCRRSGLSFEEAWPGALRLGSGENYGALVATEHAWRSAYNDVEQTRPERAISNATGMIDYLMRDDAERAHVPRIVA